MSSRSFLKSSSPGAGIMMVSRRPPTSSVIRRNRPRGFSFRAKTKVLRSIWTLSDLRVSSVTGGLAEPQGRLPYGDERSFEIIHSSQRGRLTGYLTHAKNKVDDNRHLSTAEFGRAQEASRIRRIGHAPQINGHAARNQEVEDLGHAVPSAKSFAGCPPLFWPDVGRIFGRMQSFQFGLEPTAPGEVD